MARIRYVDDDGDVQETEVTSRNVTLVGGDVDETDASTGFQPAVVQGLEYDNEGGMSSTTTVCGETENRRESDQKPRITVEGIVTEDQLPDLKAVEQRSELSIVSDIHRGPVEVRRLTISQGTDIIHYIPAGGTAENAFSFQLQLRVP